MKYIFFLFVFIICYHAEAKDNLELTTNGLTYIYPNLELLSVKNRVEIDSAISLFHQGKFIEYKKYRSNLKSQLYYWIHFKVKNNSEYDVWMFHLQAQVSHMEIYKKVGDITEPIKPFQESVNNYHKIKQIIDFNKNELCDVFILLHQEIPLEFSLNNCYLAPQSNIIDDLINQSTLTGIIIGIMSFMFVFSMFVLIYLRKKVYLFYMLYIAFHIIFIIHGSYFFEFVLVKTNQFRYYWIYISLSIGHLFYIWFIREFVGPINIPKNIDKKLFIPYLYFIVFSNVLLAILAVYNNYIFMQVYFSLPLIYALIGLLIAILLIIYVKQIESKFVLIGTCITIVSGFISLWFDNLPAMENNHIYNVGMVVDMIFFAFALSYKQKLEQDKLYHNELQLGLLEADLDHKQRELTQKAVQLAQQEEIFGNLKKQLESLYDEKNKELIGSMVSNIDFYLKNNSWDDFEMFFNEVHPQFQNKLKSIYPDLSQNDIRICSLLRLCLNTKEIANITQKTSKSIEISRSRIRQKMNLDREDNLFDVLSKID